MAQIAGEPVLQPPPVEEPDRILYAPELIEHLFGQRQSSRSSLPSFSLPRWGWFLKMALKIPGLLNALSNLKRAYAGNWQKLLILEVMGTMSFQDFISMLNNCLKDSLRSLLAWMMHYRNESEDF
jgi:hypothetical protein